MRCLTPAFVRLAGFESRLPTSLGLPNASKTRKGIWHRPALCDGEGLPVLDGLVVVGKDDPMTQIVRKEDKDHGR